ncbi:MAG: potassium-transporting ATPase subunit KdpA [Thermoplasmata archaeon]|nr:potassium-transporting ATPase subunit KdpA [Thermoplasmata archaeon]
MARVYLGRPSLFDRVLNPIERGLYWLLGTDPRRMMGWREYAASLILCNVAAIVFVYVLLVEQGSLPWNAWAVPGMHWDLALHTSSSFVTNTDYQHYTPESSVSLLGSLLGLQMLMFLSAASGLSALVGLVRGFIRRDGTVGNVWVDLVRTFTRILLPISLLGAGLLALASVPQTWHTAVTIFPLTGGRESVPIGPIASWDSIEFLGTNGGGYFAANAAHPFQNPTAVTNFLSILLMMLIPFATPFMFGAMVRRPGEAWPYIGVILTVFLIALGLFIYFQSANTFLRGIPVDQSHGYLLGAEARFTLPESALFNVTSIYSNVGAVSMSLGSLTPGAQMVLLWGMFLQSTPGGEGTGFGVLLLNAVLAIFVGGLMVGRTPEYLGKKLGRTEVKWAAVTLLAHPFAIFVPLALAYVLGLAMPAVGSGAQPFTVILYEFTSESANNGSGMAPISDNTVFFNVAGTLIMLFGRYLPIVAMLAIGGSLARQAPNPPGPGTLKTTSVTFTSYLTVFLLVITGLLFLPVLALGPLSQFGL